MSTERVVLHAPINVAVFDPDYNEQVDTVYAFVEEESAEDGRTVDLHLTFNTDTEAPAFTVPMSGREMIDLGLALIHAGLDYGEDLTHR